MTTYTIAAADTGWYGADGTHIPSNTNTYTGEYFDYGGELRSFFTFALSGIVGTVQSVTFNVRLEFYSSPDASETGNLYQVAGDPFFGTSGPNVVDTAMFADLGDGPQYGSVSFTSSGTGTTYSVTLSAQAIQDVQDSLGGYFSLGMVLGTFSSPSDEWVRFGGGSWGPVVSDLVVVTFANVIDGTSGDDTLVGTADNDQINGYDGHDYIRGNAGNDELNGGNGDDYLAGSGGDDAINGDAGYDRAAYYIGAIAGVTVDLNQQGVAQDTGQGWDTLTGIEHVSGTAYADILTGDGGDNWLWGSVATDEFGVFTGANNDTLDGGAGNDLLTVGIGNHSLTGGSDIDTVRFTNNGAPETGITLSLLLQGIAQATLNGSWTLNGIENLSGGTADDILTGDGNANVLAGDAGNDTLAGGDGDDTLYGDGFINTQSDLGLGGPIATTADGGGAGNDTLEGGLGNDHLDGGAGTDTASYANASGNVTVNLNTGFSFGADGNDTLVSIENLTGSEFNDTLTGNGGSNIIDGLGGIDSINGHSGDDTIYGGDGNDFINGDLSENNITVSGNDVLYGGNGNDLLRGGLGNDTLYGEDGDDNLRGNGGVDSFDGGSDQLAFDPLSFGDRVSFFEQRATQGVVADLRTGIISDDGYGNVETMVGIESLGAGTAYADTFYGNEGRNFLWASLGDSVYGFGDDDLLAADSAAAMIDGGTGTDRLQLFISGGWLTPDTNADGLAETAAAATAGWSVNLATGTLIDGYGIVGSVAGIENVDGNALADSLTGDANNNILNGGDGDDLLEGRGGDDTLDGGNGNDTASYANAGGNVTVDLYDGTATGADGNDTLISIENLIGGAFNDLFFGTDSANQMSGGDGKDSLYGFGGNDALYGGNGDDFLRAGDGDDLIDGGEGWDRASFYQTNALLGGVTVDLRLQGTAQYVGSQGWDTLVGIEHVSGTPFADQLTGDDQNNLLWGGPATIFAGNVSTTNNDVLDGQGGDDLLQVGIGDHVLVGGSGTDTVGFTENGGAEPNLTISLAIAGAQVTGAGTWDISGVENLSGGLGNDLLTGDANANVLAGYRGNDTLMGGVGNDTLYGDGIIVTDNRPTGGSGPITTFSDEAQYNPVAASGNDILEGGLGDDQLWGGGGSDTARYANALGAVFLYLYDGGFGEAYGADGYDQLHDMENLTGSAFNDQLGGNSGDNVLDGGDGHDGLRGWGGNDTLLGGGGDDFLVGGLGDDVIDGGDGIDRVSHYADATAGVTVDLNQQGIAQDTGQGMDTLIGIENVSGTLFGDTLIGDGNDNVLWGSASTWSPGNIATTNNDSISGGGGNDLLVAGIGNHVIDGGDGIDTFRFDENGAPETGITLSLLLQGAAQASGNGDWTLTNIENLSGSAAGDSLTGDGNDNVLAGEEGDDNLSGGSGNDTLYGDGRIDWDTHGTGGSGPIVTTADTGAAGNDTLEGGEGDDQLWGGAGLDTASYANAGGAVQVQIYNSGFGEGFGADGYDQLHNIENLTGSAFNDILTGNNLDNVIIGGAGHDFIRANAGNDAIYAGDGDDYLSGSIGDDYLDGGAGWDRVSFFAGATTGVTVDLRIQGVSQVTGIGNDTLVGIENVSGTVFSDTLIGDAGDNQLWGTSDGEGGNDTLDGQDGNDLLENGAGNHIMSGGLGTDTFSYVTIATATGINVSLALQGGAQDTGVGMMTLSGIENLSGSIYNDILTGDGGDNVLAGRVGDDTLVGGAGNDSLYGDGRIGTDNHGTGGSGPITFYSDANAAFGEVGGNDTLEGGLGDDHLDGGAGTDTASYANAAGAVGIDLWGSSWGADGNDSLVNIENAIGSAFADEIYGNGGDNVIDGRGGDDFIMGGAGDDTILGGDGNDVLFGDYGENDLSVTGNDLIDGGAGNDLLRGGLGNDQLVGGTGNDLLRGNGGVDSFDGGADDGEGFNGIGDRVSFFERRATQGAVADLRTGVISNDGFGNVETMVGIESLGGDTAFADTFYGNDDRNFLGGNQGDSLYAFGGDDSFQLISAAAIADGGEGIDVLRAYISAFGLLLADSNGDGLAEFAPAAAAGWSINLTTGTMTDGYGYTGTVVGVENVDGTVLADSITGDANANVLNGGDGDDVLNGREGDDTLDGGNGIDTASYADASGGVTVELTETGGTASGADGNDTLVSIENATGSAFNDVLIGNGAGNVLAGGDGHDYLRSYGGNDSLIGGDGDDYLNGGAGDDLLDGGAGVDRVAYLGASGGVTVDLNIQGLAQNTGSHGWDTLVGIEHVSGTIYNDVITGNGGDNWLWGGSDGSGVTGNDAILAGDGNDLVDVGAGNHTLDGGSGIDTLLLYGNATDITAAGVTFDLRNQGAAQNTEQGMMTATGFENLSGSRYDDVLTGDNAANVLAGDEGHDTIRGNDGDDVLYGDGRIGIDTHGTGYSGPIRTWSDVAQIDPALAAGNDTLLGGRGDDYLYGGRGNDVMTGNQGVDRIVIEAASGLDRVTDFALGIDKVVFDASSGVDSFSDLTLTRVGNNTVVTWGTGDSLTLDGVRTNQLTASDFEFVPAAASIDTMTAPQADYLFV